MVLSTLMMVVAATETCQNMASLSMCIVLDQPVDNTRLLCDAPRRERTISRRSLCLDVSNTASGKESEICGLCLVCAALRIENAFT